MNTDTTHEIPLKSNSTIQQRGEFLSTLQDKVGCGVHRFEWTGRKQLEALIRNGLNPWDNFLDIGCGAFCGGYWVMHFLDAGHYHGIEPNVPMFQGGVAHILEADMIELKKPKFDHNDQYDFSVFPDPLSDILSYSIRNTNYTIDTRMQDGQVCRRVVAIKAAGRASISNKFDIKAYTGKSGIGNGFRISCINDVIVIFGKFFANFPDRIETYFPPRRAFN